MGAAIRALHYPKAGALKETCRGRTTFKCVATYRHRRHRVFYAQWQGLGGWLCAGTKTTCKPLRHGFVPTARAAFNGGPAGTAELAARGYMGNHYGIFDPNVSSPCSKTGPSSWACGYYNTDTSTVTVTVTLKSAKGGYVLTGAAS
jgi:hypothetical protein